ncbi:MAG TPA: aminotransferase class V-fold PLP-dependent enzyme [Nitrospiraceae bacterium]|nr:aminotransferase class V-fold PLP-dependent enzyme [Nitrospiraceae bacterium]
MNRRDFLVRTGLTMTAGVLAANFPALDTNAARLSAVSLDDWEAVRSQFPLSRDLIHMAAFFLASHPTPVREAIERHREGLDQNPIGYWFDHEEKQEAQVLRAAADYLGVSATDIALTDSTTMGLGLLYGGLALREGQEVLTTIHDHYSTETSLRLRADRTGAYVRQIPLYRKLESVSKDEIVETLIKSIQPRTRIVAVTWVHSSTGLKLPIREMADALAKVNADRTGSERALLCVDGVHGLGVEDLHLPDLGCDFLIAGTHKWLFGPRGTGLVWGHPRAWPVAHATIPTFNFEAYRVWMNEIPPKNIPVGAIMTPGGFHSFEHRWALDEAFRFHQAIGKARIAERIHALNDQLKDGLIKLRHVKVQTPRSRALSAGIVCFEVEGWNPDQVVEQLRQRRIIASVTPYATQYVRLAPSLLTSPEEVEKTVEAIRTLTP